MKKSYTISYIEGAIKLAFEQQKNYKVITQIWNELSLIERELLSNEAMTMILNAWAIEAGNDAATVVIEKMIKRLEEEASDSGDWSDYYVCNAIRCNNTSHRGIEIYSADDKWWKMYSWLDKHEMPDALAMLVDDYIEKDHYFNADEGWASGLLYRIESLKGKNKIIDDRITWLERIDAEEVAEHEQIEACPERNKEYCNDCPDYAKGGVGCAECV